ncbi:MAG: helix-turn-helix domain-containing protein [Bacteroidetes bacterium]|nr:helix-turn-helix domain-containing protein [Bacteroidota bacterium]MCL2302836.1 helix-turn-helix domain-containing protein [Lentimicrobiaceae bacterium]
MLKKSFLITILLFSTIVYGQNPLSNSPQNNNILISNFMRLSAQQLSDTGDYYYHKNSYDTAMVAYSLITNSSAKSTDPEQQIRIINAFNKMGVIHINMCDYRSAYKYLIDALRICEKYNATSEQVKINNNLGHIYFLFKKFDIAKLYASKALSLCTDSISIAVILNNLGGLEIENRIMDSAFYFLDKSLQISKRHNVNNLFSTLNNIAAFYGAQALYDSAFYYCHLALDEARKHNRIEKEARYLSSLSMFFFETNLLDSARFYINLSNSIAEKNNFLGIMANNYLNMSKIEESKGNIKMAFEYYKKYATLKDSIFSSDILGDINQLQRLYEISKTNEQIELLMVEQQMKERTIYYQRIIWFITLSVLLLASIGLLIIYLQKRNLNMAYKILFEKNLEIIEFQKESSEMYRTINKKSAFSDNKQHELLDRILILMEDVPIICDTEFSIDKLAELVQSNQNYVSQAINNILKKNFRSLLNSYRIQEAQRLFSEPDATKYTIESVALRVGFKSPKTFREAFKEITGITPNFYLKSLQ